MCSVGCWGLRVGSHSVDHLVSVPVVNRSLGDGKLAFGINADECETHLRFVGSSLRCPPSLPSDHAKHWTLSFVRLERSIGSIVSSLDNEGTLEGKTDVGRPRLTYRSTRSAYSNILIRRIRSSLTFSKDRRSPSRSAIRACTGSSRSSIRSANEDRCWWSDECVPASQRVQFPIRYGRVRISAILSEGSGELRKG